MGDIEDADFVALLPGPFDVILIVDTIGSLDDCQATLEHLHRHCTRETRLVIAYYSHLWEPLLPVAQWIGWRAPQPPQNIMSPADINALCDLADFDLIKAESRLLSPMPLLGVGRLLNRFVSMLPLIRNLCLRNYSVHRSSRSARAEAVKSATVVIPVRNERGNVEPAIERLPAFCDDMEVIFVEGHSQDGTYEETERVIAAHPGRDIKLMRQHGQGQGRCRLCRLRPRARRRADDPRRRPDRAARAVAEVLAGDRRAARANSSTARAWSIRWRTRPCSSST